MKKIEKARLIIDSSKRNADLYYLTKLKAPDPFTWIQIGKKSILLLSELELDRAKKEAKADYFVPVSRYIGKASERFPRPTLAHAAASFLIEKGIRCVEIPPNFQVGYLLALKKSGLEVVVSGEGFAVARRKKNIREVGEIKKGVEVGAMAIDLAISMIRKSRVQNGVLMLDGEPLTSERIKREVTKFLIDRNYYAAGLIIAGNRCQTVMPHHTGSGPLHAGEAIILDFFPRSNISGYHGDITRTVVKGKANNKLKKMYQTVREVEGEIASLLKPGIDGGTLHLRAVKLFEDAGFKTGRKGGHAFGFFHGIGHGIGLEIHEMPSLSSKQKLMPGDVITIEPGLYYPGTGGIRHENVYWITADGCRPLTDYEIPFEIS